MQIIQSGIIETIHRSNENECLVILSQSISLKKGSLSQYIPIVIPEGVEVPETTGLNLIFRCNVEDMLVTDGWSSCMGATVNYMFAKGILSENAVGDVRLDPGSIIPEWLLGKPVTAWGYGVFKDFIKPLFVPEHVVSDEISEHVCGSDSTQ